MKIFRGPGGRERYVHGNRLVILYYYRCFWQIRKINGFHYISPKTFIIIYMLTQKNQSVIYTIIIQDMLTQNQRDWFRYSLNQSFKCSENLRIRTKVSQLVIYKTVANPDFVFVFVWKRWEKQPIFEYFKNELMKILQVHDRPERFAYGNKKILRDEKKERLKCNVWITVISGVDANFLTILTAIDGHEKK